MGAETHSPFTPHMFVVRGGFDCMTFTACREEQKGSQTSRESWTTTHICDESLWCFIFLVIVFTATWAWAVSSLQILYLWSNVTLFIIPVPDTLFIWGWNSSPFILTFLYCNIQITSTKQKKTTAPSAAPMFFFLFNKSGAHFLFSPHEAIFKLLNISVFTNTLPKFDWNHDTHFLFKQRCWNLGGHTAEQKQVLEISVYSWTSVGFLISQGLIGLLYLRVYSRLMALHDIIHPGSRNESWKTRKFSEFIIRADGVEHSPAQ